MKLLALLCSLTATGIAQAPPRWAVAAAPLTSIGDAGVGENQELFGVTGALRLADGRVVVANGKPRELRVYDSHGKFLTRIGRAGGGPGEFGGRIDLLAPVSDTIVVYDQGNMRWSTLLANGRLLHESRTATETAPAQVALYRRTFVHSLPISLNRCAIQLLDALPAVPPPSLREARPDGVGRFWIRQDGGALWSIYAPSGRALGAVRLPTGLELYQVGDGFIVGRIKDADDVERVVVLRVATPRAPVTRPRCETSRDSMRTAIGPRVAELKAIIHTAITAGEMAYANYGHYVTTADSMRISVPSGALFRIVTTGKQGWAGVVFDTRSTVVCTFGIGDVVPPGWPEGAVRCGP